MEEFSLNSGNIPSHLVIDVGDESQSDTDRTTKKVRFKEGNGDDDTDIMVDSGSSPKISWKDKLLGINPGVIDKEKSIVNGSLDDLWPIFDNSTLDKGFLSLTTLPKHSVGMDKVTRPPSRTRGRFARMAVYINLDKPLIAQVLVNGRNQIVEYEALLTICFTSRKYGHTNELCVSRKLGSGSEKDQVNESKEKGESGSRFGALANMEGSRKRQLLRSHESIQKAMDQLTSRSLVDLEIEFGDHSTKFFHSCTLQRRKFNRIVALRINNGEWCLDRSVLSDEAARFFENLYGEIPTPMSDLPLNIFSRLKEQDIDFLNKPVLNVEIKNVLFYMALLKAPGSDGFHAHFFQSQWDSVGGAVYEWVQGIFTGNRIENDLNNTLIMLIPKKDCPEDFIQFRPISLCSVMYKLVMKVIANRFKVMFPNFISPEQARFIAGRSISDNVIIAQEVIHSMRSRKAGRNWMAIKLDLKKAYDRISWDFIDASLVAAGIPEFLRKVIMDAISSSTMQILWNGVPSKSFKPKRGIRQGCSLLPHLFVLCMEWLGHLISSEITVGRWYPIRLSRSGSSLYHLLFSDDLIIFSKAEINQALVLREILNRFCAFSGHKISARKSNMYLSEGVDTSICDQINQLFGYQKVSNLGGYLGVPFLHDRVTKSTLNFVVDKSLLVPKGICDEIEMIARQFIWGGSVGHSKTTLVGWDSIFQPRSCGGLGFRHLHDQNNSFFIKIGFNLMSRKDALWNVDMLRIWLSDDMIRRIVSIPPPHSAGEEDRIIWACSGSGIGQSSECPQCGHDTEDILHMLRDFSTSKEVWKLVVPPEKQASWAQHFEPFLRGNKDRPSSSVIHHHFLVSHDWVQLFTDGAVARASENASTGGVVRDRDGNWILGFTHYLGRPLEAELWGILDGILILLNKGRIKRLLHSEDQWEIKYVPRECNLIADQLAKISLSWQTSLQIFEVPPDVVVTTIQQDKAFSVF
ncbi:Retrovirus-related Pol polyprotein LINE-1 [Gossypium australe]|uniref:Retrovirus-related Pol polyprotein LINE-1 n=1 Tax=Gossypium australe TaxID=47621 RepID=A0A5B6UQU5_9ROSI|nr:Retrovirus-related Pol polyprotein LINE-1 [Gossypium australe]